MNWENVIAVSKNLSSLMVIISFICLFVKPLREKVFGKWLKDKLAKDKSERAGICALLQRSILELCEKIDRQGFMYHSQMNLLDELYTNYRNLDGNHGVEKIVEQVMQYPIRPDLTSPVEEQDAQ